MIVSGDIPHHLFNSTDASFFYATLNTSRACNGDFIEA